MYIPRIREKGIKIYMFNVTVLRMKDIIKYFIGITLTICIVIYSTKYFSNMKRKSNENTKTNKNSSSLSIKSFTTCLDKTVPAMSSIKEDHNNIEETEEYDKTSFLQQILQTQISSIKGLKEVERISNNKKNKDTQENKENDNEKEKQNEDTENNNVELAKTDGIHTEVVTQNPIKETFNVQYGNVKTRYNHR